MVVHNPPYQGGIVQYCTLLGNSLNDKIELDTIGFKRLYPKILYKGKLPKKSSLGLPVLVKCHKVITWYNPLSWVKTYNIAKHYDIIHIHWVSPVLAPLYYTILKLNQWFAKKSVVMTLHNIQPHESTSLDKWFINAVYSKVNDFVVHAKENKERLVSQYGINSRCVHVIPHGSYSYFTGWNNNKNDNLLTFDGKKVILFFGYIREYKGLAYLLKAMRYVLDEEPNAVLLIAGELWGSWKGYDKIINKLGIKENIILHLKYIPDKEVYKYFDAADIVCFPYCNREQTISGPLMVSFAFGKPTIISNVGGIPELVKHEENGLLVEGGDVIELSESILRLLRDAELRKKLGGNARKSIKGIEWDAIALKYHKVYEEAVSKEGVTR